MKKPFIDYPHILLALTKINEIVLARLQLINYAANEEKRGISSSTNDCYENLLSDRLILVKEIQPIQQMAIEKASGANMTNPSHLSHSNCHKNQNKLSAIKQQK